MKRGSPSVLIQVAALAAVAVVLSQVVAFALVLTAPPPRPAGFDLEAAAAALQGRPAETADGRPLKRRISHQPRIGEETPNPFATALRTALAHRMGVSPERVRIVVGPTHSRVHRLIAEGEKGERTIVTARRVATVGGGPVETRVQTEVHLRHGAPDPGEQAAAEATMRTVTMLADHLAFAPFSAALRLDDGRWAMVEPPRDLISPWQKRVLLALLISGLLLAPLVWWMARRLTQPIRVFAEAAERLGADPDASPLHPGGPREVRTAIAAFNEMQQSLRAHMRQRTQTVAAIAHDLRTPLTRLRFRAEQAPPALAERMAADVEEMDALITQALAYVRGESPPERRERADLSALVQDCVAGFAETGADATVSARGPVWVEADPAALRRALGNLIGNAVQYGGSARVSVRTEDGLAVVVVRDAGPGLPAEDLEAVFEPFRRGERSRSRETGGAGLGLTIARQTARAHGGDVTLSNPAEGGLEVRFTLPLAD